jgi:hypothetical protein
MAKVKELTPETLSHRIREQVVTEGIMPGTHYMAVNKALWGILVCTWEYVENRETSKFIGQIYGLWILLDDKAVEMVIKPMDTLG